MKKLMMIIPLCALMACGGGEQQEGNEQEEMSLEQEQGGTSFEQEGRGALLLLEVTQVSEEGELADSPFLTQNQDGTPVLCWVEGLENPILKWKVIDNEKDHPTNEVLVTRGLNTHHETMPKIGFKANGDAVVLFSRKNPTPENKYAGSIYYSVSTDQGVNWSPPTQLHKDTRAGIGRSFFDLAPLPDGELGAIWLDGRKKKQNGSTLFFSKTNRNTFGKEIEVAQTTCQCCRTDLFVDQSNNTHIVFRDIIQDSIRDFAIATSTDNGNSFSETKIISNDRWVVNGCPHTGASIAQVPTAKETLNITWYTQGGKAGVYHTSSSNGGQSFEERSFFSENARHPQMVGLENGCLVTVWDETQLYNDEPRNRIGIHLKHEDGRSVHRYLTLPDTEAHHPVVTALDDSTVVVAWSQGRQENSTVQYVVLDTGSLAGGA